MKIILIVFLLFATCCRAGQTFPKSYSFYDDFEIGGTDNWTYAPNPYQVPTAYIGSQSCGGSGGTRNIVTTVAHSGIYSFSNMVSTAGAEDCSIITKFTTANPLSVRFYFYLVSGFTITSSNAILINDTPNSGFSGSAVEIINSSGNLLLTNGCTGNGTHNITTNVWHSVEELINSSTGALTLTLDGTTEASATGCSLPSSIIYDRLGIQQYAGVASGTAYFDDVVVNTSSIGSPSANMVVRHSPTFGRTALPIDVTMWGATNGDTLAISMDGTQEATYTISSQQTNVVFTCCTGYSAGNHTLLVQDKTGGTVNSSWTETIAAYNSSFPVSIDGYNNLSISGSGIFPILPYDLSTSSSTGSQNNIGYWTPSYVNAYGWLMIEASPSASQFATDLATVFSGVGLMSVGPNCGGDAGADYWANCTGGTFPTTQNSSITTYATELASNTHLLGYTWIDEPTGQTINGNSLTSTDIATWDSLTHASDANHLVWLNHGGYQPAYLLTQGWFNLPGDTAEVLSMDNYPVLSNCSGSGQSPETIAEFVAYVDQFQRVSFGLFPWNFDLEASTVFTGCVPTYSATGNQLKEEAWLATIHGAKAISWFANVTSGVTSGQYTGIGAFLTLSQTSRVLAALTSPATSLTVSSNQTAVGSRVDAMVKQAGTTVTVFGQRLTDIGESDSALSTTFTINGCSQSGTATVVGENRTVALNSCQITDTFDAYDTHVYQFSIGAPLAPPSALTGSIQ